MYHKIKTCLKDYLLVGQFLLCSKNFKRRSLKSTITHYIATESGHLLKTLCNYLSSQRLNFWFVYIDIKEVLILKRCPRKVYM